MKKPISLSMLCVLIISLCSCEDNFNVSDSEPAATRSSLDNKESNIEVGIASVNFQNTGNLNGWDRIFTQHRGTVTQVSNPAFKGSTAVRTRQVYDGPGGRYHSEIQKHFT